MATYRDCIVFLLAKAYQRAHSNFKRRLRSHRLTPIQTLVLSALWDKQGLSAGEIGKRLSLDNATLSGVLDRMAERGWILKKQDPQDKRVVRIYLDHRGKTQKGILLREREAANEEILRNLTQKQRHLLKQLLRKVRD
jgi:DNA-binding MarR family transcriptional regulator